MLYGAVALWVRLSFLLVNKHGKGRSSSTAGGRFTFGVPSITAGPARRRFMRRSNAGQDKACEGQRGGGKSVSGIPHAPTALRTSACHCGRNATAPHNRPMNRVGRERTRDAGSHFPGNEIKRRHGPMRPESRGSVRLRSCDPGQAPLIDPSTRNYELPNAKFPSLFYCLALTVPKVLGLHLVLP